MDEPIHTTQISPSDDEITKFLNELFELHPSLLGAQLGAKLKYRFKNLDIKFRFGGIKKLAETLTNGNIQAVRRHALDWVFERTNGERRLAMHIKRDSVWRVFHNPHLPGKLALNIASVSLRIIAPSEQPSEGEVIIGRLSHNDQRQIMREFAATLDRSTEWQPLIDEPDAEYWQAFMRTVQSNGNQADWLRFRWQRLCKALIEKLVEARLPDEAIQPLVRQVAEDDSRSQPKPSSSAIPIPHATVPIIDLRRLGHLMIDQMSHDELANIRVSLGAVLAGLNNRR